MVLGNRAGKNLHSMEGLYFRRFAPNLQKENEEDAQRKKRGRFGVSTKVKFGAGVALVFSIISAVFLFEDYFVYRKELSERHTSAKKYRELIKMGLLKSYQFDSSLKGTTFRPMLNKLATDQLNRIDNIIAKKKFCVVSTWRGNKFNDFLHKKSLGEWTSFFKRNNYRYEVVKKISNKKCNWVFPHILSLSDRERGTINMIKKHSKVIVSGRLGELNGQGEKSNKRELESVFKIGLSARKKSTTTFVSGNDFNWELPSGLTIDWPILNESSSVFMTKGVFNTLASDYKGKLRTATDGSLLNRVMFKDGILWTSLSPFKSESPYPDFIMKNLLAKALDLTLVKISDFPKGSPYITSYTIKYEDTLYPLSNIVKIFEDSEIPFTFFTEPEAFEAQHSQFEDMDFEIGFGDRQSDNLKRLNLKESFVFIENNRLGLEEIGQQLVSGIMPAGELITKDVINSTAQNNLKYIYGGQKIYSQSPVQIDKSSALYIPRVSRDSKAILNDKTLISVEDVKSAIEAESERSKRLNGMFVFSMTNGFVKSPIARKALESVLEDLENVHTLSQVTRWSELRNNLKVDYTKDSKCPISIYNDNNDTVENFVVSFNYAGSMQEQRVAKVKGKAFTKVCLQ